MTTENTESKDAPADAEGTAEMQDTKADESQERTYSQKEFDRRVSEAVKKAEDKKQAEIAKERQRLESEKLKEQGEYKALHEKTESELETLRKELENRDRREQISAAIRDAGLTDFEAVLTGARETPEDFIAAGKSLQTLIKTQVDAQVAERLNTGTKPKVLDASQNGRQVFEYPSMTK
jgi:serine phosphatase RsbU (regulator of sigma subunit)